MSTIAKYVVSDLYAKYTTTSSVIRFLNSEGMSNGTIAKLINKRYQHVRNVLITPLKNPIVLDTKETNEEDYSI